MTYSDKIKDVIEGSDVVLFMKGTPSLVMCGNSDRALKALRRAGAKGRKSTSFSIHRARAPCS